MGKGRLEAFSDGVIAVIITIMVLELRAPHSVDLPALLEDAPAFLAYSSAAFASGTTRAADASACGLAAVPSRIRPAIPCRIALMRKRL